MPSDVQTLIDQLSNSKSAKRCSAAKNLRKLKAKESGDALLTALKSEVKDKRSWQTQYQQIMAIGECDYKDALPFLHELNNQHDFGDATMQYVALGDAIVRLEKNSDHDATPVLQFLNASLSNPSDERKLMALDGALRSMAMQRMKPDQSVISEIISGVSKLATSRSGLPFWVLAAAPGWNGSDIQQFIQMYITSTRSDIQEAAQLAQNKKYKKWNPL